jgi:hypothetical protein
VSKAWASSQSDEQLTSIIMEMRLHVQKDCFATCDGSTFVPCDETAVEFNWMSETLVDRKLMHPKLFVQSFTFQGGIPQSEALS